MAHIFGGALLHAREGAHFKSEQETDLHRYMKKRIAEGKIKVPEEKKKLLLEGVRRGQMEGVSVHMEILQQKVRYNEEESRRRAEILRRVKSEMPKASEAERIRIAQNLAMYGVTGFVTSSPRLSLNTKRHAIQSLRYPKQKVQTLSPEASEAMKRQFMAGLRALTYGSFIGIVGLAVGITSVANIYQIKDFETCKESLRMAFQPLALGASSRVQFLKKHFKSFEENKPGLKDSEFGKKLKERFAGRKNEP